MTPYEIPLTPQPQTFTVTLQGRPYRMRLTWCEPAQCWILDIEDNAGVALVQGLAVTTGTDILQQFEHLGIGGALFVQTDTEANKMPTFTNLGETAHLYFVTEP